MHIKEKELLHLSHCRGITHMALLKWLKLAPPISVYSLNSSELQQAFRLSDALMPHFLTDFYSFDPDAAFSRLKASNIKVISLCNENYPHLLKEIHDPPPILFCKGNTALLSSGKMISIVGTRNPTNYGIHSIKRVTDPLISAGWTVVSGLAKGIDALAHQRAIERQAPTIGVIGGGLHHFYPKENLPLFKEMTENQLVLSEHPPDTKPQKWHFPMRNRIISGLSLGTVVIQAKSKSGSLITASTALDQGRQVFAVPGSIFDAASAGANQLIKQGAYLAEDGLDVLNDLSVQVACAEN